MTRPPRVGHIPFLNCHPLLLGMHETGAIAEFDLVQGTPTELARLALAGELDVTPLSAIEYLRHADEFELLPNLAIGATGAVRSVQLVGKVAPAQLTGPVAMTNASATSQVLLALLLDELWSVDLQCYSCNVELPQVFEHAEAALLIGDEALRLAASCPEGLHLADLGTAWAELTGLPMTYAVWAARRDFADAQRSQLETVTDGLTKSLAWGCAHIGSVIADARTRESLSEWELADYFNRLEYGFDDRAKAGLETFADRACAHGFLDRVPNFEYPGLEHSDFERPGFERPGFEFAAA